MAVENMAAAIVSHASTEYTIPLQAGMLVKDFAVAVEKAVRQVDYETIKLVVGRGVVVRPSQHGAKTLDEAGIRPGSKVLLIASKQAAVSQLNSAKDLPAMRGFDDELRMLARRRRTQPATLTLPSGPYTYDKYEAWQRPGLTPPPSEALKLLHRLAADPGIVGIMAKHRWQVGCLSEMPPEGKVGVSAVCVLGVNINHGQEISLRLRTDDLRGFRRYDSIRQTLCHELAHMVFGEHDDRFKNLNSQLLRECAGFDWTGGAGHAAVSGSYEPTEQLDAAWLDPSNPMAATAKSSGKTLAQLAAERPAGGHEAVAQLSFEGEMPTSAGQALQVPTDVHEAVQGLGHHDEATAAAELEEARLSGTLESHPSADNDEEAQLASSSRRDTAYGDSHSPQPDAGAAGPGLSRPPGVGSQPVHGPSMQQQQREPTELSDQMPDAADHRPSVASGAHEPGGTPQQQQEQQRQEAQSSFSEGPGQQESIPEQDAAAGEVELRYQRAQAAAKTLIAAAGPEQAQLALETVSTVMQNALSSPSEDKFRRVRAQNSAFFRRAGQFQGADDLLQAAGFVQQPAAAGQDAVWLLTRNDPGLLWLVLSAVRDCRQQV